MVMVVWQDATHILVYDQAMPKASLNYIITNGLDTATVRANQCGLAVFSPIVPTNTSYTLNSKSFSSKGLPIRLLPRCVSGSLIGMNGKVLEEKRSSHFALKNGEIVFSGLPYQEFSLSWRGSMKSLVTANSCGIAWLPKTMFTSGTKVQFSIGKKTSQAYLVTRDIPTQPDRYRCIGQKLYERR